MRDTVSHSLGHSTLSTSPLVLCLPQLYQAILLATSRRIKSPTICLTTRQRIYSEVVNSLYVIEQDNKEKST
jgi:hypothetical protein